METVSKGKIKKNEKNMKEWGWNLTYRIKICEAYSPCLVTTGH